MKLCTTKDAILDLRREDNIFYVAKNIREALAGQLSEDELKLLRAFDIVGDIAVVKIPEQLLPKRHAVGRAIIQVHGQVKTVLNQTGPVKGEFRTRGLEVIAGEPKTTTTYLENGCWIKVDLASAYFSPRLAGERLRIAKMISPGEVVLNMFAGVGSYSIVAAKNGAVAKIYSIDKNPDAFRSMVENIRINRVGDRVIPILGDARDIVEESLKGTVDRVIMPLPELGREFLEVAVDALKPRGGTVHFYDVGQEPDVFGPSANFARDIATRQGMKTTLLGQRKIRSYATRCYHIVLDLLFQR
ncbi:MAG: class I SAM-dependent methyltransferase family protein [Candidatus Hadarchaeota archaeon]